MLERPAYNSSNRVSHLARRLFARIRIRTLSSLSRVSHLVIEGEKERKNNKHRQLDRFNIISAKISVESRLVGGKRKSVVLRVEKKTVNFFTCYFLGDKSEIYIEADIESSLIVKC